MSGPPPQRSGTRRGAGVKSGAGGAPRGPPTSSSTQERRQDLESLIRSYQIEETGLTDFIGVDADYVTSAAAQIEDDGDFQSQANFLEFQRRLALMDDGDSRGLQGEAATFVTFVKGFVGIGILSLPYAMSCGGYIGGPVGLTLLAYMAYRCMIKLLESTEIINERIRARNKAKAIFARGEAGARSMGVAEAGGEHDTALRHGVFSGDVEDKEDGGFPSSGGEAQSSQKFPPARSSGASRGSRTLAGRLNLSPEPKVVRMSRARRAAAAGGPPLSESDLSSFSTQNAAAATSATTNIEEEVRTFGDVGKYIMGKSGKKLINVSIIITQAGFGIAYLIFIPENIQKVLCYETDQTVCPSTISITFFTVLALLPFVFLQNMKTLVIPTLLANVSLLIGISWGYLNAFGWTPEARSNADEIGEAAMPEGSSGGRMLLLGPPSTLHRIDEKVLETNHYMATLRYAASVGAGWLVRALSELVENEGTSIAPSRQVEAPEAYTDESGRVLQMSPAGEQTVANALLNAHKGVVAGFPNFSQPSTTSTTPAPTTTTAAPAASGTSVSSTSGTGPPSSSSTTNNNATATASAVVVASATATPGAASTLPPAEAVVDPETKKAEDAAALKHIEQKTKQDLTKKDKEKLEQLKPPSFVAFNFAQYPIFFGIAVFAFEGIGLLLPCQRAMQKPARMHAVVTKCMWFLTVLFVSFGLSCYVRWGGKPLDEETVQDRRLVEDFDLSGPDVVPGWRSRGQPYPATYQEFPLENFAAPGGGDRSWLASQADSYDAANVGVGAHTQPDGDSGSRRTTAPGTASFVSFYRAASAAEPSSAPARRWLSSASTASPPPELHSTASLSGPAASSTASPPRSHQAVADASTSTTSSSSSSSSSGTDHSDHSSPDETIGVQAMVTFNYPESTITSFVILFYVLGIFFSFPVMMFPVFTLLENSLFIRSQCCLPHRKVIKRVGRKVAGWCFGGEDRFRSWYYVESTKEDAMAEEEDAMSDFEDDDEQEYFSEEAGGDVEQLRQRREVDPDTFAIEDDDDEDNDNEDNESENRRAASRNSVSAKVPAALPGTTAQGVAATSGIVATGLPSTSAPAFRAQDTAPDGDGRSSSDSPATRPPRTSSRMVVGALPSKEGALRPAPDMGVATVVGRPIDGTGTAGPTTATAASPEIPSLPRRRSSRRRSSAGSLNITVVPFLNLYEKCLLRVIVTILAALTALTIPHFGLFLSLLGSITCNLLAFILPAYFHYYMTVVVVGKNTTEDANLNDHTLDVHAATPREDVFYAGFGILAGLWSFVVTTAEFF
eukprot:CAMPEP_0179005886 /NCGR_PEP_ID=MMETSP0795-20121207/14220_1 /TAXON_ID=88552 /ORGANISM="Amoebophrya sp., Strain Ameob2" /LENGTH=1297 /DNA_ID=CAMNT_0020700531 /DNA_START=621 /DNA_END=4514 /DNA_ORIENTATION=-